MDARELRIGNFVIQHTDGHYNLVNTVQKVVGIIGRIVYFGTESGGYDINNRYLCSDQKMCHPIPLTEEMLLKMAGINDELLDDEDNSGLLVPLGNDGACIDFPLREDPRCAQRRLLIDGKRMDVSVQYLHQLQNLYFALTGKELEVKL